MKLIQFDRLPYVKAQELKCGAVGLQPPQGFPFTGRVYHAHNHQRHCNPCIAVREADILEDPGKAQHRQRRQRKAFRTRRTRVVHFHAVEFNVRGH